jgi:hypothetical protein
MTRSTLVSVLCIGIAIGACAREAVRSAAPGKAYAAGTGLYHVLPINPGDWEATERMLNDKAKDGWRYLGSADMQVILTR